MVVKIVFSHPEIPIEEAEKLLLHEVNFSQAEAEVVVPTDGGIASPVLILGRGVVEVFRGQDEGGKKDAVGSAFHALSNWWQSLL